MLELSKRLKTISTLVPKGARVCDVGTDHGYLPIYLKKSGIAKNVIATDIREKPLLSAKRNLSLFDINDVDLRLCDGLSGVNKGEADTVIIAGMGGEVISGIIERCDWVKENPNISLILQPMTSPEILREFLVKNKFSIIKEETLEENQKIYNIIFTKYSGFISNDNDFYYFTGEVDTTSSDGKKYLLKQYRRCASCADALKNVASKQDEFIFYNSLVLKFKEKYNF